MSNYESKLRSLVNEYKEESGKEAIDSSVVARWAYREGKLEPQEQDIVQFLARQISRALRNAYFTDPQGRKVRANHVVVENQGGTQIAIWRDIRTAPRDHVKKSMQQRRRQIAGDCTRLKTDLDSYNENFNTGEQLELCFDFTRDLKEAELVRPATERRGSGSTRPTVQPPALQHLPNATSPTPAT